MLTRDLKRAGVGGHVCHSAFFWLLSMLLSSLWWLIIPPMQNQVAFQIAFAVLFQELFRWLFVLVLK